MRRTLPWLVLAAPVWSQLVREPYLQSVTETSVTLVWRTELDSPEDSRVRFGVEALDREALGASVVPASNPDARDHVVRIDDLEPGTTYRYEVGTVSGGAQGGGTPEHVFRTAPERAARAPFRAWIVGDSGTNGAHQHAVRDAMLAHTGDSPPDLFLHLGDIAYSNGEDSEYTANHFGVYSGLLLRTPFWPAIGNHDATRSNSGPQTGPYYEGFVLPSGGEAGGVPSGTEAYYAFDYANVHFVVLDTAESGITPGEVQLQWLEEDLAATEQDWVVAMLHHPPYTKGSHDSDDPLDSGGRLRAVREHVVPVLEAGGVDLVVAGHSHIYERSFLVDGAHGYGDATPPFEVLQADGHILDDRDGRPDGDGAYTKLPGRAANEGAVFVVAGHGGKGASGTGDHPLMAFSEAAYGSVLLTVDGDELRIANLREDGAVTDEFALRRAPAACEVDANCPPGAACSPLRCEAGTCVRAPVACSPGASCDPRSGACVTPPSVRTLQDGFDGYEGTLDTFVAEGMPDVAFGDAEAVGWDTQDSATGELPVWSLLRFAVFESEGGPLPDAVVVVDAALWVTVHDTGTTGDLHEALVPWDEGSTFADFGPEAGVQPEDLGALVGEVPGAIGSASVDVTESVRRWHASPGTNLGWAVAPRNSSGVEFRTREHPTVEERPALVVRFMPDGDRDGVPDDEDSCPELPVEDQWDSDGDGVGDACDPCPLDPRDDADGDGLCADLDGCPEDFDPDQFDGDADGRGDACDPCPLDPNDDAEGDGVCADQDNCIGVANPDQADSDGDGIGDICDPTPDPPDAGVEPDAAPGADAATDATPTPEAGAGPAPEAPLDGSPTPDGPQAPDTSPPDGAVSDAGAPEPDGGAPEPDGGAPEPDGGAPEADTGAQEADAGAPPADGGRDARAELDFANADAAEPSRGDLPAPDAAPDDPEVVDGEPSAPVDARPNGAAHDPTPAPADGDEGSGCGCDLGGERVGAPWLLLLAWRRRRRRPRHKP